MATSHISPKIPSGPEIGEKLPLVLDVRTLKPPERTGGKKDRGGGGGGGGGASNKSSILVVEYST